VYMKDRERSVFSVSGGGVMAIARSVRTWRQAVSRPSPMLRRKVIYRS